MEFTQEKFSMLAAKGWYNHINLIAKHGDIANLNAVFTNRKCDFFTPSFATIHNECVSMPCKPISYESDAIAIKKLYSHILMTSNWLLQEYEIGYAKYLITNVTIGSELQSNDQYSFTPIPVAPPYLPERIYCIGSIAGIQVFINPMMTASDTRIIIGTDKEEKKDFSLTFYITQYA